jgi:hypothetical protein
MKIIGCVALLASLSIAACSTTRGVDTRTGPLFCDEVPQPKRYLTEAEAATLGEDWIDIVVTILARGKKHCGWDYQVPEKKG